jgi:DNA-binding NtrC family response regulator
VVDDDNFQRQLVRSVLERAGMRVTEAPDAATARALISGRAGDVMVLDFLLPDGNAIDVWGHALRNHPDLARRTVIVTGALNETDRRRLEQSMGLTVLTKPFQTETLVGLLGRLASSRT